MWMPSFVRTLTTLFELFSLSFFVKLLDVSVCEICLVVEYTFYYLLISYGAFGAKLIYLTFIHRKFICIDALLYWYFAIIAFSLEYAFVWLNIVNLSRVN